MSAMWGTEVDYLVVGAGAMGMAFVDTLLTESDATVVMVDRYHQPGGHWTVAYPYVRLHQPSSFYGVGSTKLGGGRIDEVGWNKGLYELATAGELCAYFDQVMQRRFLPSGRVSYHPKSEYEGDGRVRSLVTGERFEVRARKVVDATYMKVTVPSMRPPAYEVADGVDCVPPNALATEPEPAGHYTVVGAGKTGVDACLWLLANGVEPAKLTWIMPRDAWYVDRATLQPGEAMARRRGEGMAARHQAIVESTTVAELLDRLCATGQLLRLSAEVRPTMYRCATVTTAELDQLRRIDDVVRLGRVRRLGVDSIELDGGTVPARPDTRYVDCTADGLAKLPTTDVFRGDRITLQALYPCQQVFSAALIGHIELAYEDDAAKNELAVPAPHPNLETDVLRANLAVSRALLRWSTEPDLVDWLVQTRLMPLFSDSAAAQALLARFPPMAEAEIDAMEKLLAQPLSAAISSSRPTAPVLR